MLIRYILQSLVTGIFVGVVVCAYRGALIFAEELAVRGSGYLQANLLWTPVAILLLATLGYCINLLVKNTPAIQGGGILYVQEAFYRTSSVNFWRILINKFLAGFLAICGGLFLGKVGPSLQISACIAQGLNKQLNTEPEQHGNMLAAATCASITAAMTAPIAGIIYTFEKLSNKITLIRVFLCLPSATITYLLTIRIFGHNPIIIMQTFNRFQGTEYLQLIFLGIVIGIFGFIFNELLIGLHGLYAKHTKTQLRVFIPLLLSLVFAIYFPIILGLGNRALDVIRLDSGLDFILLLFACKTLFFLLAFAAGIPGGMFFPVIIIGSLFGSVVAELAISHMGVSNLFFRNIVLVSMAGFFAAVMRAPITAVILVSELTLSVNNIVPMLIVCPISYYIEKSFRSIYEKL